MSFIPQILCDYPATPNAIDPVRAAIVYDVVACPDGARGGTPWVDDSILEILTPLDDLVRRALVRTTTPGRDLMSQTIKAFSSSTLRSFGPGATVGYPPRPPSSRG
jgi:hypothetical protein